MYFINFCCYHFELFVILIKKFLFFSKFNFRNKPYGFILKVKKYFSKNSFFWRIEQYYYEELNRDWMMLNWVNQLWHFSIYIYSYALHVSSRIYISIKTWKYWISRLQFLWIWINWMQSIPNMKIKKMV